MARVFLLAAAAVLAPMLAPTLAAAQAAGTPFPPGEAPPPGTIFNTQVNLSNTIDTLNVVVTSTPALSGTSLAAQNAVSGGATSAPLNVVSVQQSSGNAAANLLLQFQTVGTMAGSATAFGNTAATQTAGVNQSFDLRQQTALNSTMQATARVENRGNVNTQSTSATAAGNAVGASADGGLFQGFTQQTNAANVFALDLQAGRFTTVWPAAIATAATSAGNSAQLSGVNARMGHSVAQVNAAPFVQATSNTSMTYASNVLNAAAASGNSLTATSRGGIGDYLVNQANSGLVRGETFFTSRDFAGASVMAATGAGNSVDVNSQSRSVRVDNTQNNAGLIQASASLTAQLTGGVGSVTASALGNAFASLSAEDGATVRAVNRQANVGGVTADSVVSTQANQGVAASSSAVGNSATFIAGSSFVR